jgi:SSS family solute:Na+ symporter
MATGTAMAASASFKSVIYPLPIAGYTIPAYAALYALAVNLAVTSVLTGILRALRVQAGQDRTLAA